MPDRYTAGVTDPDMLWQLAPAPALVVGRDGEAWQAQLNAAAQRWCAERQLAEADWQAIAARAAATDTGMLLAGGRGIAWHAVPLGGQRMLLWLSDAGPGSDDRTRLTAEAIGVGFWSRDLDAGGAHWDEQMYRIHRRPRELGPPGFDGWIDEHVHTQDRSWVHERHARATRDWEAVVDAVFRSAADDDAGNERWIQSWTRRLVRDGRRLAFGMHMDVSERLRVTELQRRERERTQFALQAADVGVWERTLDGHITYWNEGMYRLRGLDPADPRPMDELAATMTHPDDHAVVWAGVQRHVQAGLPYRFEARVRRADGQWRWVLTQGRALRDAQGRIHAMAGINLDITERKQREELRLQKDRAEQAARDQAALMARVSHELRTPMNAVLGFTQLLEDDPIEPPSPRQRERLQLIAESGARLMTLIDELLELASLEEGAPARVDTLELGEVLQPVQALLAGVARRRGTSIEVAPGVAALVVRADRRQLQQALIHLLGHALRRQPPGSAVQVSGAWRDDGVQLRLRDHGRDLDEAARKAQFDSFLRPEAAGRTSADPPTLGLNLARRGLRAMGGEVSAQPAADGPGNTFVITLPAPPQVAAQPLRVLCIEDNAANLTLVRDALARRPLITLLEAVTGEDGVQAARRERPDLVLVDMQLPGIGGDEVLAQLRGEPATSAIPCVALSANAMPEQIQAARAAGFDDYWTKPLDIARFVERVEAYGARRSRTQPLPSATR